MKEFMVNTKDSVVIIKAEGFDETPYGIEFIAEGKKVGFVPYASLLWIKIEE